MSAAVAVLLAVLLLVAAARMLRGRWMLIESEHVEVDYRSLTLGGLPMEEIYDPATAVRHPYPLSEPCDLPVFVNAPRFELFEPEPWERHRLAMLTSCRAAAEVRDRKPNLFSDPSA